MMHNNESQVFVVTSIARDLEIASVRARAAVESAKREAIRTLAVLEFRAALNGRK